MGDGVDPAVDKCLRAALDEVGIPYERARPGAYLVTLAGSHKLATATWLVAKEHSLLIEAFFCRRPDEKAAGFYQWLLERNASMYGVHFALDHLGDVYLLGRQPLSAISATEVDRLLGCVLTYADEGFDRALELGFGDSIRREWAWRLARGESVANLQAFSRFADPDRRPQPEAPVRGE